MKILITGIENSLSKYIKNYFDNTHEIYSFTRDELDISNREMTYRIITDIKPDILIHVDSMSNIDTCESDESLAYTINTIGTLNVAYPCSILNIPIIYLSTSYVYGGEKDSPYFETDKCSPVNIYGKTKLAGEKLIRTLCKKYFIVRTGWIFGEDNCFVKKVLSNKNVSMFVCSTETGSPTYVADLCNVIEKMFYSDLYGIYNCGNPPSTTKSTWVKKIFNYAGIERRILEIPENFLRNTATRPKNSSLNISLIKNCFDIDLPDWEDRLIQYINTK
ncbi:SDR family oxidoreductase [Clostridium arbusti]|uniref:SDR family oxidoreductase n=1 Tax=Clostridium arbusti TaxID=1137848 RepID=UPI00028A0A87|nr:NAD(P)-dependent oxidoreductase [Clostridium arbusti]